MGPRGALPLLVVAALAVTPVALAGCPFAAAQQAGDAGAGAAAPLECDATLAHCDARELLAAPPFNLKAVEALDVDAVKADLTKLMTSDSQSWWPADNGHYGGLFIRLAWHCNGSYRKWDGRGGCDGARQRFEPELSWPDNTNLDKARRLLAPIKQKYGDALSWGDLIVLAGDTAIESMGGPKIPFCLGRVDDADGTDSLELGPTPEQRAVAPCTAGDGNCENPLGQTTMSLIYVDPEGVLGEPVPEKSVSHIRHTFGQMGMNDVETVALIGGGHAFGKTHGACPAGAGPGPDKAPANPWPGLCGSGPDKGKGKNTFTSGFEGPWTTDPTAWDNEYFHNLLNFDWVKHKGPGNHFQWKPAFKDESKKADSLPDIMMLTTDVALIKDPVYLKIVKDFAANQTYLTEEFGKAWYKLMTRDMGPRTRCLGKWVAPAQPWQMPLPEPTKQLLDFNAVKADILKAISTQSTAATPDTFEGKADYGPLFATLAYQCASTFRRTDYAGGCNGARIRFAPQRDWPANRGLHQVLDVLKPIKEKYPGLSWADLIVLAGTAANERATRSAAAFPFCGGRADAADAAGTDALAPRRYANASVAVRDNAKVMGLTPEEAVALAGRLRSGEHQRRLGYSGGWAAGGAAGGTLDNSYFKTLLGESWEASKSAGGQEEFKAKGKALYMTPEDLAIKADPQLAAIAKGYADDGAKFASAFAAAWRKLMNADRFKGPAGSVCDA